MTQAELQRKRDAIIEEYNPTVKTYTMDGETITLRSVEEFKQYIAYLDSLIAAKSGRSPVSVMKPKGNSAV
jgi:hypothetical protein